MARESRAPEQVNIRLNDDAREALEAYRAARERQMRKEMPGFRFTHTEALRTLLLKALADPTLVDDPQ